MEGRDETSIDMETGEILYPSQYNAETGEYEGFLALPQRVKFQIPPQIKPNKKTHRGPKMDEQNLELITAAIFLLPTAILFNPVLWAVALILEIVIHSWTHKKNSTLRNDTVHYYRSPLHGIVKEFCAKCKDSNAKEKISKLQDRRNDKMRKYGLESIRRVVT
ncbi:uncharacterized protein LOC108915259 [Anoplophora glabripennis]|nr:uncharacterized protein LOC108915259 [Anoplophora glabripennis]XP_018576750.1 uncharacterized protein LOC108915259 [Anoplophora glabripennis]XP_018576751.1 uncharacterized protein LOC108915259 [Anoplophora glabripennis]XP_018576752.1 uncharacterized protein LOC108915259 [Anoplophora glabripennis]XP_018576753.1 uncharacterized protein LOC108915259 [Anoplophora glabripennis]